MPLKNCKECNKQFNSTIKNRNYCSEDCSKEYKRKYSLRFQRTPAVRARRKEYLKSEKGKKVIERYRKSEKGKATVKAAAKRFAKTPSGKKKIEKNNEKWRTAEITKERLNRWLLKNPDRKEEVNNLISKEKKITNQILRQIERKGEKNRAYNQKYFSKDKGKKKRVENMTSFYKVNPHARFILAMRNRISGFMEIKNMTKRNRTFHMIGCTPQELIAYIEKQFQPGMTWGNWSINGWHIDHIIPLDSGKNQEEVEKLCHYTNLQPMWAAENRRKSNKY